MLNVSLFFSIVKLLLIIELHNNSKEQLLEFLAKLNAIFSNLDNANELRQN